MTGEASDMMMKASRSSLCEVHGGLYSLALIVDVSLHLDKSFFLANKHMICPCFIFFYIYIYIYSSTTQRTCSIQGVCVCGLS